MVDECSCVYACGVGAPDGDGGYTVTHSFWDSAISARVGPWCADGECTEAFLSDLPCDITCFPKPADSTCHFQGAECVSGG